MSRQVCLGFEANDLEDEELLELRAEALRFLRENFPGSNPQPTGSVATAPGMKSAAVAGLSAVLIAVVGSKALGEVVSGFLEFLRSKRISVTMVATTPDGSTVEIKGSATPAELAQTVGKLRDALETLEGREVDIGEAAD